MRYCIKNICKNRERSLQHFSKKASICLGLYGPVYTRHASSMHLITLFSRTPRKKREVSWNYYYFERNATTNNCTCARTHTKYLITAGVRGRVRNFLLQIPLTLRENSGNVSGKFLQRNNGRSRDIVAESRPRAGSVFQKRKKEIKRRKKERGRGERYIWFFATLAIRLIMRGTRCVSPIHVPINTKVLSGLYSVSDDKNGKIYSTQLCAINSNKAREM